MQGVDSKAVQRVPASISSNAQGYEVLVVAREVACVDEARSRFTKWEAGDGRPDKVGQYRMFTHLAIDYSKVPKGSDIFRIAGWHVALVVSGRMRATMEARVVEPEVIDGDGKRIREARVLYKNSGIKAEDLLSSFRNSLFPRIVVTVDMIATGTDVKPLEVVMFMRAVKSRLFYEQMKGRGVRTCDDTEFQAVTPDASSKTRFVLVDCVGLTDGDGLDDPSPPLDRKKSATLQQLLESVVYGAADADTLTTLASRLLRLERSLPPEEVAALNERAGTPIATIAAGLLAAADPESGVDVVAACKPLAANPELRRILVEVRRSQDQVLDGKSLDEVLHAGHGDATIEKARQTVAEFKDFIVQHKDEIAALEVVYSQPWRANVWPVLKRLRDEIARPPRSWTVPGLWEAYARVEAGRVRGSAGPKAVADLYQLVRHAIGQQPNLEPFREQVDARYPRSGPAAAQGVDDMDKAVAALTTDFNTDLGPTIAYHRAFLAKLPASASSLSDLADFGSRVAAEQALHPEMWTQDAISSAYTDWWGVQVATVSNTVDALVDKPEQAIAALNHAAGHHLGNLAVGDYTTLVANIEDAIGEKQRAVAPENALSTVNAWTVTRPLDLPIPTRQHHIDLLNRFNHNTSAVDVVAMADAVRHDRAAHPELWTPRQGIDALFATQQAAQATAIFATFDSDHAIINAVKRLKAWDLVDRDPRFSQTRDWRTAVSKLDAQTVQAMAALASGAALGPGAMPPGPAFWSAANDELIRVGRPPLTRSP